MKRPVKIVIIGAGSINFGVCILNDLVTSRELDSEQVSVVLVDIHAENLAKAYRYAQRAGAFTGSHLRFSATPANWASTTSWARMVALAPCSTPCATSSWSSPSAATSNSSVPTPGCSTSPIPRRASSPPSPP